MIKNRDYIITDGVDNTTIVAECGHCGEPWILIGKIPEHLYEPDNTVSKWFCRGANGLSYRIRCCYELNCIKKKGTLCDLKPVPKGKEYPVNKSWSVIVIEPVSISSEIDEETNK